MGRRSLYLLPICVAAFSAAALACSNKGTPIFSCKQFKVYPDSVVQGKYSAVALSPYKIVTNYKSANTSGSAPVAEFRFSINSRDNEMHPDLVHRERVDQPSGKVFAFGDTKGEPTTEDLADVMNDTLPTNHKWTVRVDMRPMLRAFRDYGRYVTPTGDTIAAEDFQGVWICGSVSPMNWDFDNLWNDTQRKLKDRGDSIYEVTIPLNPPVAERPDPTGWAIEKPVEGFPQYSSDQTLVDACWNMAMDEVHSNLRPDSAYSAGKEWEGVWTRDVSYSIWLSLAVLDPQGAQRSLMAKVDSLGRIIQDSGTGGSWPVSSDRQVWALAAWEIYCVTGDRDFLAKAYDIVCRSLEADVHTVLDRSTSLMHGEQSYLDWRQQTYPYWMQPADIYESMCLGTNVVFARAFAVRGMMARELGVEPPRLPVNSADIQASVNDLMWNPRQGYYASYLYSSPYPIQSPTTDNLGQALAVIFDVATPQMGASIISHTPVLPYGTPSVFPQQADVRPYHNDAVWPFVQAFWNVAAAQVRNYDAVNTGLAAIYRAAALFATNKELMVASTGDFRGTAVNSDAQLWSACGNAAMPLRVFAGMRFHPEGISFNPLVPENYPGTKRIKGLGYRGGTLDVTIRGTGHTITAVKIDGKACKQAFLPAPTDSAHHTVEITLDNNTPAPNPSAINFIDAQEWLTPVPMVAWTSALKARMTDEVPGATFNISLNGVLDTNTTDNLFATDAPHSFTQVNVTATGMPGGPSSFSPRPHYIIPEGTAIILPAKEFAPAGTTLVKDSASAAEFVEMTLTRNTRVNFELTVPSDGRYFVDLNYSNGSGPVNTWSRCAIRTLLVNGQEAGAIVMPQRGLNQWLATGWSNMLQVDLKAGRNILTVEYVPQYNMNMDGKVNTALVRYMRLIEK